MSFNLGKPIAAMLLLAVSAGIVLAFRPSTPHADINVWLFAESHARILRGNPALRNDFVPTLVEQYEIAHHQSVRVDLISNQALDVRLISMFMSRSAGPQLPELAEVEVGAVGEFFRPPVEEVGFLPLNDFLDKGHWRDKIVANRFAPWTKSGVIFGVPMDVHPITLTYRRDLFDAAGVNLRGTVTWDELRQKCLAFQRYWRGHGLPDVYAMDLPLSRAEDLNVMLLQRGINLLDDNNQVHLNDPRAAQTLAFYATLVSGPDAIGSDAGTNDNLSFQTFASGGVAVMVTPDWRAVNMQQSTPALSGKLAMIPLPRFDPTDPPTSTWGGTMVGIPRDCADPQRAWDALQFFYLSPQAMQAVRDQPASILPPLKSEWANAKYHQPDSYFGGQKIEELYIELAPQIPPRYVTPYTPIAAAELTAALNRAVTYADAHGSDGLDSHCQQWLDEAAAQVREQVEFGNVRK